MKIRVQLDCGHGCPPIHMDLDVEQRECSEGHQHLYETERGQRMAALGMTAHMNGVHGG